MNVYNMGIDLSPLSDAVIGYGLIGIALLCAFGLVWVMFMSAEIINFIPRPRHNQPTDFPTIVFKSATHLNGIIPANLGSRENAIAETRFVAPDNDCA